jgi:pimeloyl-ACP methyl ester carboxylesterase
LFRPLLDPSVTFDFVDGPYPSEPAAGVTLFHPGPYYQYWRSGPATTEAVLSSHTWLLEKLARDGPYDGVMLFSQGCSVVASFLMYHPASPFKVAIFICGSIPLQVLESLGVEISEAVRELEQKSRALLEQKISESIFMEPGKDRLGDPQISPDLVSLDAVSALNPREVFGLDLTAILPKFMIKIPTVHIYGSKDPTAPASIRLAHLCDPNNRKIFDHGGGHDIPRSKQVSEDIANLIMWGVSRACTK